MQNPTAVRGARVESHCGLRDACGTLLRSLEHMMGMQHDGFVAIAAYPNLNAREIREKNKFLRGNSRISNFIIRTRTNSGHIWCKEIADVPPAFPGNLSQEVTCFKHVMKFDPSWGTMFRASWKVDLGWLFDKFLFQYIIDVYVHMYVERKTKYFLRFITIKYKYTNYETTKPMLKL